MPAESAVHRNILRACRHVMRPIARLLLRVGIDYKQFSEVCKASFVEVASKDYGVRGRPANISRVALLTGLSRKEVRRQRDRAERATADDDMTDWGLNRLGTVLTRWHQDEDYLDERGKPRELPREGEDSLEALARSCGGDIPPKTMLAELERAGAIRQTGSGGYLPTTRYVVPPQLDPKLIQHFGVAVHDLADTIAYNMLRDPKLPACFEASAWSNQLRLDSAPRFQRLAQEHGLKFLELFDEWLSMHEVDGEAGGGTRTGVHVFFFDARTASRY